MKTATKINAKMIEPDGTVIEVYPNDEKRFTNGELAALVTNATIVELDTKKAIVINGKGHLSSLAVNKEASRLYGASVMGRAMVVPLGLMPL